MRYCIKHDGAQVRFWHDECPACALQDERDELKAELAETKKELSQANEELSEYNR